MSQSIEAFAKRLKSVVIGVTTEAFEDRLKSIMNNMSTIHKMVRAEMTMYLAGASGSAAHIGSKGGKDVFKGTYPKIKSGNLIKEIARSGLKSTKWTKVKIGNRTVYSIKNWLGIDNDGNGNRTVKTGDGRNAPYAYYLNVGKNFVKYHGYFDSIGVKYRATFKSIMDEEFQSAFGSNHTYRY